MQFGPIRYRYTAKDRAVAQMYGILSTRVLRACSRQTQTNSATIKPAVPWWVARYAMS